MPVADVRLMLIEATELAGMLTFTNQWLAGPDREQLAASLSSFVGTDAYRLTELLTDLPCSPSCRATSAAGNYLAATGTTGAATT